MGHLMPPEPSGAKLFEGFTPAVTDSAFIVVGENVELSAPGFSADGEAGGTELPLPSTTELSVVEEHADSVADLPSAVCKVALDVFLVELLGPD